MLLGRSLFASVIWVGVGEVPLRIDELCFGLCFRSSSWYLEVVDKCGPDSFVSFCVFRWVDSHYLKFSKLYFDGHEVEVAAPVSSATCIFGVCVASRKLLTFFEHAAAASVDLFDNFMVLPAIKGVVVSSF